VSSPYHCIRNMHLFVDAELTQYQALRQAEHFSSYTDVSNIFSYGVGITYKATRIRLYYLEFYVK